jgi:hypothetical protein
MGKWKCMTAIGVSFAAGGSSTAISAKYWRMKVRCRTLNMIGPLQEKAATNREKGEHEEDL